MQTIQRLILPDNISEKALYFKAKNNNYFSIDIKNHYLNIYRNITFDSYFNAFFLNFWLENTTIRKYIYQIKSKGKAQYNFYLINSQGIKNILLKTIIDTKSRFQETKIPIEIKESYVNSRICCEVTPLVKKPVIVAHFNILVQNKPLSSCHLGIIICTYKKEKYVLENYQEIKKLNSKKITTYIIDNGQTLLKKDFTNQNTYLVQNPNLGGSGGFSRGMYEARYNNEITHFLLMDDDILLFNEVLLRTITLIENSYNKNIIICGDMLDNYKKTFLYESGGVLNIKQMKWGPNLFLQDLNKVRTLNILSHDRKADYQAWWYFCYPKEAIQSFGYSFPFFIRFDDIEYNIRLSKKYNLVFHPSIAVYHEPFYLKDSSGMRYFDIRNALICMTLYNPTYYLFYYILIFIQGCIYCGFLFDYKALYNISFALKDFLKGPTLLTKNALENSLQKINNEHNKFPTNSKIIHTNNIPTTKRMTSLKTILSILTLNGHLLPNFLLKAQPSIFRKEFSIKPSRIHNLKKLINCFGADSIIHENIGFKKEYHKNTKLFFKVLFSVFFQLLKLIIYFPIVKYKYKKAFPYLISEEYWEKQFKVHSPVTSKKK